MNSEVLDLSSLLHGATGPSWGTATEQLNATFLVWNEGHEIAAHVNHEVDVVMVVVSGEGLLNIDGTEHRIGPGSVAVIPKGAERAIRASSTKFAYLNVHRRRSLQLSAKPPRG